MSLGKQIKVARQRLGLTQAEVSKALGYSTPQFVSNWERGLALPPIQSVSKLSKLISVPEIKLIDGLVDVYRARCLKAVKRTKSKGNK